jgi:hypothetical protein
MNVQPLFRRDVQSLLPIGNSFTRLITAQAVAAVVRTPPYVIAAEMWPSDRVLIDMLTRAASAPAMTTVAGWAAELVRRIVDDALKALGPVSAAAKIFQQSLVLTYSGSELISVPGLTAGPGFASFVAEGLPIPVYQFATTPALINPHKIASIAVLTREMIESSNAEALISDVLLRSIGAALDVVLFDANPETAARPAGLRNGIAALTPSAATDGFEAVFEDIASLIDAVAPVGGTGPYIIVGSPGRIVAMNYRFTREVEIFAVASSAAGGDLYAIAPQAFAVALAPMPATETVKSGTLVMDTAPGAAGTMGTEKSMFQTDSLAIKARWPVSWVLRDPRGFAWLTPTWK